MALRPFAAALPAAAVLAGLLAPVPRSAAAADPTEPASPPSLRDRLGVEDAARLLRSSDPDERLRGVEQAADLRSPEALALLGRAAGTDSARGMDPKMPAEGIARTDPRAVLAVVRALATWTDREDARAALASLVSAPNESFSFRVGVLPGHAAGGGDAQDAARVVLARREAAIVLAGSGSSLALEALVAIARGAGPGRDAAIDALAVHPPSGAALLGGVVLTTPAMIALAAGVGDLRALHAVLGAVNASDPALRAAAFDALGASTDTRVLDAARAALHEEATDATAMVRLAAARALVRLGASDAAEAVAALVASDLTAQGALVLARDVQGDEVTRALVARTEASDPAMRAAAIAALGRQASPDAIRALAALVGDARAGGDALAAIARSPSGAALAAIEALGDGATGDSAAASRRLAARAYFVRRFVRGERSERLDALLGRLAASNDPRDRGVGVEALVALGERPVRAGLADADPHVRAASALGSMALEGVDRDRALLDRMEIEPDPAVARVLAFGWAGAAAPRESPSTTTLVEHANGGGPDAPLAAVALGRRTEEKAREALDALLAANDPVLRAHAARGLAESARPDAAQRLAGAYAWESDAGVRRAIVEALASRGPEASGARDRTLSLAARLDPDRAARWTAERGLQGKAPARPGAPREVLWVRLVPAEGTELPPMAEGTYVRSDGLAVPVAFDPEGFALVPGVPPGEGTLRLAPGEPPYSVRAP
jgi:HEAT repeat protein